jgi:integrase
VRLGEALGLRWEDLDLGASPKVRIARTLSRGRIGSPKGGKARTIALSPQLAKVLKRLEVSRLAWALEHGKESAPESVFTTSTGHTVSPSDVRRILSRALVVAGVARHHSPHSFRHTVASLLLSRGESIQYVKELLGHSDIKLTVNVYGKWLPAQPTGGGVKSLDPVAPAFASAVAVEAA